ncbi:MAG: histidinol-phosphate transaminase [Dehalococcoidia bacterium]
MTAVERRAHIDVLAAIRSEIVSLSGYEPVEPVEALSARLGIAPERIAKLDGNENPYGPSPLVLERLSKFRDYNIYPDPDQRQLREALSRHLGVGTEYLIAGAGSDELIQLLVSVFLAPGDTALDLVPTFGMYSFETDVAGGRSVPVQRRADFTVDLAAVAEAIDERARLIFATSPNNPTGNLLSAAELDGLLELGLPVVVDEAYIEFAASESYVSLVPARQNLIVLRTFSKWAGLAGLRVGYAAMAPALAEVLFRVRQPYSINVAAEVASVASLEDAATLMQRVRLLIAERERLFHALEDVSYLQPLPSETNFILCNVLRGSARQIRDRLREFGVFIRYFDRPLLQNCIRISVGLPHHTDQVRDALTKIGSDLGLA